MNRSLLTFVIAAGLLALPSVASATNGNSGYTGKPNISTPAGQTCASCHGGGGAAPTITGPATLAANAEAEYTVSASGTRGNLAFDAAVCEVPCKTDGTPSAASITPVSGVTQAFDEVIALRASGNSATYKFKIKAPPTGGTIRLYTVVNSTNGSGSGGDQAGVKTMDITVTGGSTPVKDGGTTPPKTDGGTGSGGGGGDGGTSGDDDDTGDDTGTGTGGGTGSGTGTGTGDGTGAGDGTGTGGGRITPKSDDGGCQASPTSPEGASALAIGFGLVLSTLFSRRRNRKP